MDTLDHEPVADKAEVIMVRLDTANIGVWRA